ncbi:MAG: C-GCAxxG-C-C family protein [Candidatus Saccharibacteria bacterium]
MNDKVKAVEELFKTGSVNCAQAVLSVYGKELGLDSALGTRLASGFGAGMGRQGLICGAVSGAFLVLSLTYQINDPDAKEKVYSLIQDFTYRFKKRHGSIVCAELLGYDISTSEGFAAVKEQKLTETICPNCVKDAAEILQELLETH